METRRGEQGLQLNLAFFLTMTVVALALERPFLAVVPKTALLVFFLWHSALLHDGLVCVSAGTFVPPSLGVGGACECSTLSK